MNKDEINYEKVMVSFLEAFIKDEWNKLKVDQIAWSIEYTFEQFLTDRGWKK